MPGLLEMIIGGFGKICGSLLGMLPAMMAAKQAERKSAGDYLEKISQCLKEVGDEIHAGNIPHGQCARLLEYGADFDKEMRRVVRDDQLRKKMGGQLVKAHEVEMLAADPRLMEKREEIAAAFDVLRNTFGAIADKIRAGIH